MMPNHHHDVDDQRSSREMLEWQSVLAGTDDDSVSSEAEVEVAEAEEVDGRGRRNRSSNQRTAAAEEEAAAAVAAEVARLEQGRACSFATLRQFFTRGWRSA